ncbi:N-acetyltransferase [Cellulomonas sp. HZM]|uniref:GNAT family N-acetyltransferase n=1 Tax=Cellulomonas sp. HZM TaxID=1454010 RepID=UPI000493019E|nr:N-acetyltransferase [Cellulomonas sp. HZM]
MSIVVRPARPDEAAAVARLAAVTFPLACPPGSTIADQQAFIASTLSPARFAEYLADPARVVLVAHAGDEHDPVGYTMLVEGDPTDPEVAGALRVRPTIELSKCYVHPDHHGAGAANALMEASVDEGRARGAAAMWLGVNQLNERAQRFYRRHGFERVGVKHFQVGDRLEDDFVLERVLPA